MYSNRSTNKFMTTRNNATNGHCSRNLTQKQRRGENLLKLQQVKMVDISSIVLKTLWRRDIPLRTLSSIYFCNIQHYTAQSRTQNYCKIRGEECFQTKSVLSHRCYNTLRPALISVYPSYFQKSHRHYQRENFNIFIFNLSID